MAPTQYEIRVSGELCGTMLAAFPGMTADFHEHETVLAGELRDQAALYQVLDVIDSLNLCLMEVRRLTSTVAGQAQEAQP